MTRGHHRSPDWLKDRWADQKNATVTRIAAAVASLRQGGNKITYTSICRSVQSLYGISISPNTIKRNQEAYEIYSTNGTHAVSRQRKTTHFKNCSKPCLESTGIDWAPESLDSGERGKTLSSQRSSNSRTRVLSRRRLRQICAMRSYGCSRG